MNKHIFLDNITATVGAWIAGKKKFFFQGIKSPSFEEQVGEVKLEIPFIVGEGIYELDAKTLVGDLDPAFCVAQWKGRNYPTIIFHHGNNERPFEFKKSAKNTFYNIFINTKEKVDANLIVVRAPFHKASLKQYQEKMTHLSNFTAMIAASVQVNEGLIQRIRKESSEAIVTTGISLGGWVSNLHKGIFNTSTAYAPLMAGTFLGELFLNSKYRKMASGNIFDHPHEIRRILNFDDVFRRSNNPNIFPLLAKYDQFIQYEVQSQSYKDYAVNTIECGHVTGALSPDKLRSHIFSVLEKSRYC